MKRTKVEGYPGIYYQLVKRVGKNGTEKMYYASFKRKQSDGSAKLIWAKCGGQYRNDTTPARANQMRAKWIDGEPTPQEQRKINEAKKKQKQWNIDELAEDYFKKRPEGRSKNTDQSRYNLHLKKIFGEKLPEGIHQFHFDKFSRNLLKKRSPQTVSHCVGLLKWIVNHGVRKKLCKPLDIDTRLKHFDNRKTEDLTTDELKALLKAIEAAQTGTEVNTRQAAAMMKLAMLSGLRRGEMFKLQWSHINYRDHEILLVGPKGGKDQRVPMSESTEALLKGIDSVKDSPFVFPDKHGNQRKSIQHAVREIADAAKLPKSFRPLHGLRHHYARTLINADVSLYEVQKLLTHKSPTMTQRYAELKNKKLREASDIAGTLLADTMMNINIENAPSRRLNHSWKEYWKANDIRFAELLVNENPVEHLVDIKLWIQKLLSERKPIPAGELKLKIVKAIRWLRMFDANDDVDVAWIADRAGFDNNAAFDEVIGYIPIACSDRHLKELPTSILKQVHDYLDKSDRQYPPISKTKRKVINDEIVNRVGQRLLDAI